MYDLGKARGGADAALALPDRRVFNAPMTETRRNTIQQIDDFALEILRAVEAARADGLMIADDIAEALNREGRQDYRGQQWTAEALLQFLGSDEARRAERVLRHG